MARKRKYVSTDGQDSAPSLPQRGIKDFANVRKPHQPGDCNKRTKTTHVRQSTAPPPLDQLRSTRKRKRHDELQEINANTIESLPLNPTERPFGTPPADARHPDAKRSKTIHLPASQVTPSRKAAALFENLALGEKITPIPFTLGSTASRPRETSSSDSDTEQSRLKWPEELEALLQLNGAFLSALSLYYAHNGASSPVEVGKLLRMTTDTWKARKVSMDDIRMLLAVGQADLEEGFVLEDYGRGGIQMARAGPRGRAIKRNTGYVDEASLKTQFRASLRKRWRGWIDSTAQEAGSVQRFIQQLPLAAITQHKSVELAAPLFARGEQRLADLKASQAASNTEGPSEGPAHRAKVTSDSESRGTTLLNRILAKQSLALSLPTEPTKAQLERKAALQRVEGVARTLVLLAAGRPRCSFSLTAVTQHLQQSLRSPISIEEAQTCLEIMAKEITPGFVSVAQNGSVRCVTVAKSCQVGLGEIKRRIAIAESTD